MVREMAIGCGDSRSACNAATTNSSNKNSNKKKKKRSHCGGAERATRLIRLDGGRSKTYHRRVYASELMAEFPKHLICHSDSFCIGQKLPALSERDELEAGDTYLLLPAHFFHSALSFATIATFFASSKASPRCFEIHKTLSGTLQVRVSVDDFVEEEEEEEEEDRGGMRVCTTAALAKEYRKLVGNKTSQWKPRLETIRESDGRGVAAAFGVFRKVMWWKKGTSHRQWGTLCHHHHKQ